jgi:hypothetical protein
MIITDQQNVATKLLPTKEQNRKHINNYRMLSIFVFEEYPFVVWTQKRKESKTYLAAI